MRAQLVRHVEDRTRMLAAVSHDLRTPLTRLRLRAESIDDAEERAKAQSDIVEMEKMIAETLAFARADALESSPERFDFAALLQTLVDEREDLGREISYKGPQSLIVEGRAGALKRALANLIDNALIYGERAEVTLAEYPDRIEAAIVDEGPGIPRPSSNMCSGRSTGWKCRARGKPAARGWVWPSPAISRSPMAARCGWRTVQRAACARRWCCRASADAVYCAP